MSKQQYNLHTKTDYLNRKMFLDPAGPVTIQPTHKNRLSQSQDVSGPCWPCHNPTL